MKKIAFLIALIMMVVCLAGCQKDDTSQSAQSMPETEEAKYKRAQSLLAKDLFADAVPVLEELGSYEDSAKLLMYCRAAAAGESGDYDTAFSTFRLLGDFKESSYMITYYEARQYESRGSESWENWLAAADTFDTVALFRDSKGRAEACRKAAYDYAVQMAGKKDYDLAVAIFRRLNTYSDAALQILAARYAEGEDKRSAKDWDGAVMAFEQAGSYSDATEQIKETRYQQAKALYDAGEYIAAYNVYQTISGYKDVDSLLQSDELISAAKKAKYTTAGSIISFGSYEQDNDPDNGPEPIEWIVLDYDEANHRTLLLSKYGLEAKPYNTEFTGITWEKCTLRAWLNNEFLNGAFSAEEQSAILVTEVDNSAGQCYSGWSTSGGNNTQDRVFLLSYAEANKYLGVEYWRNEGADQNLKSRVASTDYAIKTGAYVIESYETTDGKPAGWWWLRSPGSLRSGAALVNSDGSLRDYYVDRGNGVVRPAFWLNLESGIF